MSTTTTRGRQVKPTKDEIREYYQRLRQKAATGNVEAIVALLKLTEQ